jgi:protein-tyrosine phosphatase
VSQPPKASVLFVCMGNICRSPAAEGVFRHMVMRAGLAPHVHVDSAGTLGCHEGDLPDPRMRKAAAQRGYALDHRARQVQPEDFERFDYVLAMDDRNMTDLVRLFGHARVAKTRLLLDWHPQRPRRDVPDPYYGGAAGFELVLDLVEAACEQLLLDISAKLGLPGP